jgi:hypothetical protein
MISNEDLKRLLYGRCTTWPECSCGQRWNDAEEMFEEWKRTPPTSTQIEMARLNISLMLHCVAKHCPDKRARRNAIMQLLNPVLDIEEDM